MKRLLLLLLPASALAMTDPTLPPPSARAAASAVAPAAPPAALRLQGLRPGVSALVDGRLRRVGERWDGHQLVRVEAREALLRDPEGRLLRLTLYPPSTSASHR